MTHGHDNEVAPCRAAPTLQRELAGAALLLVWVLGLPYLCRLYKGLDWMLQYLPDSLGGVLFFGAFNAVAVAPLLLAWFLRKRLPVTWYLTFAAVTGLICLLHHDYDLAADAQAAIALVIFPFFILVPGLAFAIVSAAIEWLVRKNMRPAPANPETAMNHP